VNGSWGDTEGDTEQGEIMRGRRSVLTIVVLLVVAAALGAVGCGGSDGDTSSESSPGGKIIIGAALGMVGDAAPGDVPASEAMEYQVDAINKAGGVDGKQIELIIKDMKSDPALGGTVTQELLDAGAQVIIAPAFPGMGAGVVQTAAKAGVPVLSATSTQPEYVVVGGSKAYLVAFGDNVQAAASAEYALEQGFKTAYTLTSPDLSYTERLPEFFSDAFAHGGGKTIGDGSFTIGQQDFAAQVTKIQALDPQPDVIYTGMFPPDTGVFVRQLRAAGVKAPLYGADGCDQPALIELAGKDANGIVFTTHGYATPGSAFEEFMTGFTEFQGKAPEAPALAALGGDTIEIVKAAVMAAGSTDPEAVSEALANLKDVPVVTGNITYAGTEGIPSKTVAIVEIEDGEFVFKESITPSYIPKP
jgi:branched-chain amino acid transport system substrate-binding protein